jgi:hypothetical protein
MSHLTKYPREAFKRIGKCVRTRAGDSAVPASVSPGVVEPAIAPNAGRDGSAFRVGGGGLAGTVGSSGSIV